MIYFIFLYNLFLIVLYTIAATAFFISYFRVKKPVDIWIAFLFAFYILDNTMIYMTEIINDVSQSYINFSLSNNNIKSLILVVFILCYGNVFKNLCKTGFLRLDFTCYALFIVALMALPLFPESSFIYWLYLNLVRFPLAYAFTRAYLEYKKNPFPPANKPAVGIKTLYVIVMAFIAAMILEDSVMIFLNGGESHFTTRVHRRNISEDFYSIYIVALASWYLLARTFITYQDSAVHYIPEEPAKIPINGLDAFAKNYKITPREAEILQLLMEGFTNQQISDKLFITLGTAKNHIHNIYQKCEVTKRSELLQIINRYSLNTPQQSDVPKDA